MQTPRGSYLLKYSTEIWGLFLTFAEVSFLTQGRYRLSGVSDKAEIVMEPFLCLEHHSKAFLSPRASWEWSDQVPLFSLWAFQWPVLFNTKTCWLSQPRTAFHGPLYAQYFANRYLHSAMYLHWVNISVFFQKCDRCYFKGSPLFFL